MRPHRYPALLSSLLVLGLLLPAAVSDAQGAPPTPLGGEPPTTGIRLHAPAVIGSGDAASLEINPAGLGWLRAWSLRVQHTELREKARFQGTGTALFAAAPLPLWGKLVFGVGFQWLRPSDAIGYPDTIKLSIGAAFKPRPWVSFGMSFSTLINDDDDGIDGIGALDLGLSLRPLEWIGLGATVQNVNTPKLYDLPLSRVYDLELALRPLATRRLEVGVGVRIDERRGDVDPHARLVVEPISGLRLFAHLEVLRRDFYRSGSDATDVRATTGIAFDFERVGFAISTALGRRLDAGAGPLSDDGARSAFQGASISLSLRGDRRTPLVEGRPSIVVVRLKQRISQARLVRLIGLFKTIEKRASLGGLFLRIDGFGGGWAMAQELRAWIKRLRKAKKRVYAYLRAPGARAYYVAAAADRVLLDPAGGIRLQGLASRRLYFRGLFDKIGAKPQFIKIAEYKSAPESYTRKGPSPAALKMRTSLVDDLFTQLVSGLAKDRGTAGTRMRELIDKGPYVPPKALEAGLVDEILAPDLVSRRVRMLAGARLVAERRVRRQPTRWPVGPAIAVIVLEGDIVRGKSKTVPLIGRKVVGDKTIARALAWAGANGRVRGVVLRINSPGGSAMASDRMWRAVRRLAARKPVVVSMGDVAASGGYYAAAGGQRIFAMPATITGSIGIFTGKFDLSALLSKIGVTVHGVERGKRASMDSFTRPYTDEEKTFILSRMRYYYDAFVAAVSANRKLSKKAVDAVARGRVWTGKQALANKLVDSEGGLTEAIEEAKRRAGIADRPAQIVVLPRTSNRWLRLAKQLLGGAKTKPGAALPMPVRELLETIPPVLWHARSGAPLARLPFMILP